jgi:hypothetical protein
MIDLCLRISISFFFKRQISISLDNQPISGTHGAPIQLARSLMPLPNIIKWFWYRHNWSGRENAHVYWKAPPPAPNIFIFTTFMPVRCYGITKFLY